MPFGLSVVNQQVRPQVMAKLGVVAVIAEKHLGGFTFVDAHPVNFGCDWLLAGVAVLVFNRPVHGRSWVYRQP